MKAFSRTLAFIVLLWVCPIAQLFSAPLPEVILAGEQPINGQLVEINAASLRFSTADDKSRDVPVKSFVRWSHPRDPVRRPRVLLNDGSELVADLSWTTDGSVQLAGDDLEIRTSLLGRIAIPRRAVRGILFDASRDPVVEDRVLKEMESAESPKDDQVWLLNGDRLAGQVTKIDGAIATLKMADQSIDVPLTNLSAVAFSPLEKAKADAKWALGLQDGTLLRASEVSGDENGVKITLSGEIELSGKSIKDVVFVQNLAGEFTYLSDLEPIDFKHTPYFDIAWPLALDKNLHGQSLRANDRRYLKGVAMHSASRAVYRLAGDENKFQASIALDDSVGDEGSAIFQVYDVRNGKPELAYESDIIRGGDSPKPISVDIAGAQGLILLVDYADYGDQQDHANWLDARLVR